MVVAPLSTSPWNMATMLKTSGITQDVQQHLIRVYATLTACVLSAMLSAACMVAFGPERWSLLSSALVSTAGSIWLCLEPEQNYKRRFGLLMTISAAMGLTVSTLVTVAIQVDAGILVLALLVTTLVFTCFTASALLATRRSYLYLGGILSSALSLMFLTSVLNLVSHSSYLFNMNLYGGLFLFCGYVVFDTQMIIEKASMGDKDVLKHTLNLFMGTVPFAAVIWFLTNVPISGKELTLCVLLTDLMSIFVRVLIALLNNKKGEKPHHGRRN